MRRYYTDFEKGFIRAEIVSFDDLMACGSMAAAKEKGLVRLIGNFSLNLCADRKHNAVFSLCYLANCSQPAWSYILSYRRRSGGPCMDYNKRH